MKIFNILLLGQLEASQKHFGDKFQRVDRNDTIFFLLPKDILIDEGMEQLYTFLFRLPIFLLRVLIYFQKEIHVQPRLKSRYFLLWYIMLPDKPQQDQASIN